MKKEQMIIGKKAYDALHSISVRLKSIQEELAAFNYDYQNCLSDEDIDNKRHAAHNIDSARCRLYNIYNNNKDGIIKRG